MNVARPHRPWATLAGLALLAAAFGFAAVRLALRAPDRTAAGDGRIVLRVAHWQLEAGIRDAIDELSRRYEALHPHVRIEQILVPVRLYPQWFRTQFVGGTAPDLLQLSPAKSDEIYARYLVPLSEEVELPNPYNEGTPLAHVRWRDTFLDGIAADHTHHPNLLEYYGIPNSMQTVRIYYNQDLWRRVTGHDRTPGTYEEFLAVCEQVGAFAAATGRPLLPLAASLNHGPQLISHLGAGVTQRLARSLPGGDRLRVQSWEVALALLAGDWSLEDPAYVAAQRLAREVGQHLQPGFLQLRREDSTFHFLQQHALMLNSGSWDSPSLRREATFPIGVFPMPLPSREHPDYGAFVVGPVSEAGAETAFALGLARTSRHPAQAIDFLQFLSSVESNRHFTERSGWLPAVVGVEPAAEIRPFAPHEDGTVRGFDLKLNLGGGDTRRVHDRHLHLLVSPTGGLEAFQAEWKRDLPAALRTDLERDRRRTIQTVRAADALLAGLRRADDPRTAARLATRFEAQTLQESRALWVERELTRTAPEFPGATRPRPGR